MSPLPSPLPPHHHCHRIAAVSTARVTITATTIHNRRALRRTLHSPAAPRSLHYATSRRTPRAQHSPRSSALRSTSLLAYWPYKPQSLYHKARLSLPMVCCCSTACCGVIWGCSIRAVRHLNIHSARPFYVLHALLRVFVLPTQPLTRAWYLARYGGLRFAPFSLCRLHLDITWTNAHG